MPLLHEFEFEGSSQKHNFAEALHEALLKAIDQAKSQLRADRVTWSLEKVNGVNGGVVDSNELSVMICAAPFRPEDPVTPTGSVR